MASTLQYPAKRIIYSGLQEPIFSRDILIADETAQDAANVLTGLNSTDFAIISGMDYTPGTPGTYSAGTFYLNGQMYYCAGGCTEGLFVVGSTSNVESKKFGDGTYRNIYTLFQGTATSTSTGASPVFSGTMNAYRIGLKYISAQVGSLLVTQGALGSAAYATLGTSSGQVLTADQTYTQTQANTLLAAKSPSYIGEVKNIMILTSGQNTAFLALFNGSGSGIAAPWLGWHLLNGQDGYPDMTGRGFVGIGTSYPFNTQGGSNMHTNTIAEMASHNHGPGTVNPSPNDNGLAASGGNAVGRSGGMTADQWTAYEGGGTPYSIQNEYQTTYFVYRYA